MKSMFITIFSIPAFDNADRGFLLGTDQTLVPAAQAVLAQQHLVEPVDDSHNLELNLSSNHLEELLLERNRVGEALAQSHPLCN